MPERPGSASRSFPEPAPRPARLPHGRGPGEARSLPQLPRSRRLHAQGRLLPRQGAQERRRIPRQALPPLSAPRSAGSSLHVPWRASRQSFLPRNRGSLSLCRRAATGRRPPHPLRARSARHRSPRTPTRAQPVHIQAPRQQPNRSSPCSGAPAPARGAPPHMRLPREAPPQASFPSFPPRKTKARQVANHLPRFHSHMALEPMPQCPRRALHRCRRQGRWPSSPRGRTPCRHSCPRR